MDTTVLESIGLTRNEIKVYLALLKLGQSTAGPIVDEAKVTRSKIYDLLERLKNKGLVSSIIKESTNYFSAANPHSIMDYLEKKEQTIKAEKQAITNLLPQLMLEQSLSTHKKMAEIFIGIRGMHNAFNVLIAEFDQKELYYAFGAGKGENIAQIQLFFSQLHQKRVAKKVKSSIIFNESSRGFFSSQEKSKYVQVRYLSHSTPAAINIYKNYVLIAILNQEPITFLINNKETADSFKEYFKIMWDIAIK